MSSNWYRAKRHHPRRHGGWTSRDRKHKLSYPTQDKMGSRERVRPEREQSRDPLQALALILEPIQNLKQKDC